MEKRYSTHCPVCGNDSKVYESRNTDDGFYMRRRKCITCGRKWTTLEKNEYYNIEADNDYIKKSKIIELIKNARDRQY